MSKQNSSLEWHTIEQDADWEALFAAHPTPLETMSGHSVTKQMLGGAAVMLLVLVGISQWWHTAQRESTAVMAEASPESEIADTAPSATRPISNSATAAWGLPHGQTVDGLRASIQIAEPGTQLDIDTDAVEIHDDRAFARVIVSADNSESAYRQTRFYRHTASGWLRTLPEASLWGPERSLETPNFVYHFRQNDTAAVIAVAAQIDALYAAMQRDFGVPLAATPQKLIIEVSVSQNPGLASFHLAENGRLSIASPAVYQAPIALTDADLLAQSIVLSLLDRLIRQASEYYALGSTWQPLLQGIQLWQLWHLDLPLSVWREDVVRWIYIERPATALGQPIPLPTRYPELCVAHQIWMSSPLEIAIPLVCAQHEWEYAYFPLWRGHTPPTRLAQLAALAPPKEISSLSGRWDRATYPGQVVVLAVLIEYSVATYGREQLPTLLASLSQYNTWETLIPAVYGVSANEFEADWPTYIATHYKNLQDSYK